MSQSPDPSRYSLRSIRAQGSVIGPGSLAIAHKADQFVPRGEFMASNLIYRDVVLETPKRP
jgi:acetylornithine deacetylase/succinyl-diaminopimelate desuccinylase